MAEIPYDSAEFQGGGNWVKWEKIGDSLTGTITGYRTQARQKSDGTPIVNPVYVFTKDDGDEASLEVGQVDLKAKLKEVKPQLGDRVRITYVSDLKIPGKASAMKQFEVLKSGESAADRAAQALQNAGMVENTTKVPF